jgi:hypothetical protein
VRKNPGAAGRSGARGWPTAGPAHTAGGHTRAGGGGGEWGMVRSLEGCKSVVHGLKSCLAKDNFGSWKFEIIQWCHAMVPCCHTMAYVRLSQRTDDLCQCGEPAQPGRCQCRSCADATNENAKRFKAKDPDIKWKTFNRNAERHNKHVSSICVPGHAHAWSPDLDLACRAFPNASGRSCSGGRAAPDVASSWGFK